MAFHTPLSEMEKHTIIMLRIHYPRWSWQEIADLLNVLYTDHNQGTRIRDTIYQFMVKYRKEQRAQMAMELRLQGMNEDEILDKLAEMVPR